MLTDPMMRATAIFRQLSFASQVVHTSRVTKLMFARATDVAMLVLNMLTQMIIAVSNRNPLQCFIKPINTGAKESFPACAIIPGRTLFRKWAMAPNMAPSTPMTMAQRKP